MPLFGPSSIVCPAGVWTTLISRAWVQMPGHYEVTFTNADGRAVAGRYVERKSRWIFPGPPVEGALAATMSFERGYWNTFHSVQVLPTAECTAVVR